MSGRLVGLISVPVGVDAFAALARAFDQAWPGCTVGITQNVEVPTADGARYNLTGVPIYEATS